MPQNLFQWILEKAFGRLMGLFVLHFKRFGFGNKFICVPLSLHSHKKVSLIFFLSNTLQGCLISLLLFTIAIEPLAVALRSSQILGILREGFKHKLFCILMTFCCSSLTQTGLPSRSVLFGVWANVRL